MSTTISGTSGVTFPDSTSMQTGQQACKAWVNFNGTGTVAIRAAYNVSSITDNATGQYSCNFTNALVDGDYSVQITAGRSPNVGGTNPPFGYMADDQAVPTTSSFRFLVKGETSSLQDQDRVFIAVFSN